MKQNKQKLHVMLQYTPTPTKVALVVLNQIFNCITWNELEVRVGGGVDTFPYFFVCVKNGFFTNCLLNGNINCVVTTKWFYCMEVLWL